MNNKPVHFLLGLLTLTYCQAPAQSDPLSPEAVRALDTLQVIMERATVNGDYETIVDHYTSDGVVMPDFAPPIRGRNALLAAYKDQRREGTRIHSFSTKPELRWQKDNQVFERGSFGMSISAKESQKPAAYYGSYFQIWERESDGQYRIQFTIWNLDFNPYGP